MNTIEILKAHAPKFLKLDRMEQQASEGPWMAFVLDENEDELAGVLAMDSESAKLHRCGFQTFILEAVNQKNEDAEFIAEARNQTRSLLDGYAESLCAIQSQQAQIMELLEILREAQSHMVEARFNVIPPNHPFWPKMAEALEKLDK